MATGTGGGNTGGVDTDAGSGGFSDTGGADTGGTGGNGICDSGLYSLVPECDTYLGAYFCARFKNCQADSLCFDCLVGRTTGPDFDDSQPWQTLITCYFNSCGDTCGTLTGDSSVTPGKALCDLCLGNKCCEQVKSCQIDTPCAECLCGVNTGIDCGSNPNFQAYSDCTAIECSTECDG